MKCVFHLVIASAMLAGASVPAKAAIDFTIDRLNSEVVITNQTDGFICSFTSCGVDAELALEHGETFSLGTGETETFDFIQWSGRGKGGFLYDVTATLAFSNPTDLTTTSGGSGFGLVLFGYIVAGSVFWDDVPAYFTLANGSKVVVDFEEGITLLSGHSVTSTASVKAISVVPLPATLPLMAVALLSFAFAKRIRRSST